MVKRMEMTLEAMAVSAEIIGISHRMLMLLKPPGCHGFSSRVPPKKEKSLRMCSICS